MKILITADCYTPTINGVVTSILNLETELRRLGHDVKILCPSENFHSSESENVYRIGSVGFTAEQERPYVSVRAICKS